MVTVRLIRLQFIVAIVLCCAFFLSSFARDVVNDENFLEVSTKKTNDKTPNEIKIVSYNMRWRGGDDLKKLIELFKTDKEIGGASIIGLQEVDRNKKRTKNENTIKTISQSLDMNYAWAAPPNVNDKEEETGVAILSLFPLTDVARIVLPIEGPDNRRRAAIGATVQIGNESVRVYSVHAETRISSEQKIEQLKSVVDDFEKSQIKNAIVLGDFNTIFPAEVESTTKLFQEKNFITPFSNKQTTWTQFLLELKLDWLWLRGLHAKESGINKQITLSDHFPLWVKVSFSQTEKQTDTPKKTNEKLRKELLQMEKKDQDIRNKEIAKKYQDIKLARKENEIDLKNTKRLKEIIAKYGFPYSELVGKDGTGAAFIIIQHSADHAFQEEMLPYIEKAAKRGDIPPDNYALLVDRTRTHKGLLQLYGTQASFKDGKLIVDPIEDEEKVDERRKALGLPPLEEYLKMLSELYKMPVERKPKQN